MTTRTRISSALLTAVLPLIALSAYATPVTTPIGNSTSPNVASATTKPTEVKHSSTLSPAEKKARHKARWKERYAKASPEEKKRMDERKAKWDAATPEQRKQMRLERQKHKGAHMGEHKGEHAVDVKAPATNTAPVTK
jgi:hypothetical protein